ncbi:site-2 protease family protein [Coraliomargarita parva]|uniref:site-2 protease family protein n=1 Tax=Coraliomargarita parva TaxID=3014050 RepID=UPI0022B31252|nr:site-2 protease family protein [Coraliomargarita parva]
MTPEHLANGLILYLILVICLSVHEWAHAFVADKLGDTTPRSQGRVTLNPIAHMDLIGTVILPLVMILFNPGFVIFGWGKPVMIDKRKFKNWKRDDILVSMAGPASNLLLCVLATIVGGFLMRFNPELSDLFVRFIVVNAILLVFNLVPIPPLDGSHVLKHLIGMKELTYFKLSRYGFLILLVLINFPPFQKAIGIAMFAVTGVFTNLAQIIAGG